MYASVLYVCYSGNETCIISTLSSIPFSFFFLLLLIIIVFHYYSHCVDFVLFTRLVFVQTKAIQTIALYFICVIEIHNNLLKENPV